MGGLYTVPTYPPLPQWAKNKILSKNSKLGDFIYFCFFSPKFLRDKK
jgi:hypothetical protein